MTREEEIMKEVEECFEYFDKNGYDEEFLSTTSAFNITNLIIKHEQDTLKEFVEWYKMYLNDLVEYEKDLYADANNNKHEDNATFFAGEINMLKRLLYWIDTKPERFLEEHNGK